MVNKKFLGFLVINWKTKSVRYVARKPKSIGPYEIPLTLDINIELPDPVEYKIKGSIVIPEAKAKEIIVENI